MMNVQTRTTARWVKKKLQAVRDEFGPFAFIRQDLRQLA